MKRFFPKSDFSKNTLILISGTVVAQAIPLILHPFLRRIYTPEDFGAMAVFLSIFSMVTIVSSFRYEATIVLPKEDNDAANILGLTFIISVIFNILILLTIVLFKDSIINFIGLPIKYENFIYLLPITSFLFSFYQSLNYWLVRQKAFKASSINKIVRRAVEGTTQVTLGLLKIPGGLFVGDFVGNFSNVISGIGQIFKHNFSTTTITKNDIIIVLKRYIDYPKYNVVPTLLSSAASLLPFLFINKFYSTEAVGYLDLSRMILSIPLIFISATIAQVLFQQMTEKKHQLISIKKDLLNIFYLLIGIIALEAIVLFLFGDELFKLIFGENYILSSIYSKILIFSFSVNFITSTFSSVYITFDKIKLNSIWQITYFGSICCLLFFTKIELIDFIKIYVGIEVIMSLINCFMLFNIVNSYEQKILKN
ncbi:MAG: oligosaccharide flippase family protein [Flavobacteriales bacterium]|nr:oligosaccharide flippase family protein [Flavobacteriales bacterium]